MKDDIQIIERRPINVKDAVLIEGFPSVGMASSIVSNYIVKQLEMEYVGSVSSRYFHPTAIIHDGVPMPPVRIYSGQPVNKKECVCDKIVVLTSEFPPPVELLKPLVDKVLNWSNEKEIKLVISVEGILGDTPENEEPGTYAIASTDNARKHLLDRKIIPLDNGIITGISGVLLAEAERMQRDVICLLSEANPNIPDARSAARLIEVLDQFLPKLKLDAQPLLEEAELLEGQLRQAMLQAQSLNLPPKGQEPSQVMYG